MTQFAHKIGAVLYVVWGILHLIAGVKVYALAETLPVELAMVRGRVFQDAWNLLLLALLAVVIAITMNWKNDRTGYWLNLLIVGISDIGFIIFIVMPGLLPLWPEGMLGPVVWLLALLFTTVGILQNRKLA